MLRAGSEAPAVVVARVVDLAVALGLDVDAGRRREVVAGRGRLELGVQVVLGEDGDEDVLAREAAAVRVLLEVELPVGRGLGISCLLYTSPSPRDQRGSRMPSSA